MKSGWQLVSGTLVTVLLVAIFGAVSAWAATPIYVRPDGDDDHCNGTTNDPYPGSGGSGLNCAVKTIQKGVDLVDAGGTVIVAAGTYNENVTIGKNLKLLSIAGRDSTTIEGISGFGSLGTIVVTNNTTGVQIGDTDQGFTIIGIDNGNPAVENAAVYFQGNHSNAVIKGNNIVANGDHGLLTEYGATITGFVISNNIFSGKTFVGDEPGGCGFGQQFSIPNVPRQLVVMGNGAGDLSSAKATNITFTNNEVIGTAGGNSNVSGCETTGQGNTLVTLDVANSVISHNVFAGHTRRYGASLRVRRPNTVVVNNFFNGGSPYGIYIAGSLGTMQIACNNIVNHSIAGIFSETATLNAENNWWGDVSGPGPVGTGSGDHVSTKVDFTPWVRVQVPPGVQCGLGGVTDTDNDGLADTLEMGGTGDQDPSTTTDPLDPDTDNDGLLDGEDENHNGRIDTGETDPNNWDTDGDNLCDGSASLPTGTACTTVSKSGRNGEDLDGDESLADRGATETDPTKADTDGDGINDFDDDIPLRPGGGGCFGVAAYSIPTKVTYRPTARRAATRTIVVTIINNSGGPITVPASAFTPQPDEVFTIVRVSPTLPRTILNRRRASFSVLTRVAAGQPPVTTVAPYFNINLDCGVVSSAGVKLTPLELEGVQAEMYNNQLRVEAYGAGISSMQVEFFDLAGRPVMEQESKGNVLVIALPTGATGKPLAKGVYLYVVTVKGYDGSIQRSEVRKLVLR